MTKPCEGIWNQFLEIDLSLEEVSTFQVPQEYYRAYLGGKAMGARLINDFELYDVEPLSPENLLMILAGPASGTTFPGAAKAILVTRSPLTGIYLDSATGGKLVNAIKRSGYDGIVIKGRARKPSYLLIEGERVEIVPAGEVWGMTHRTAEDHLRKKHNYRSKGSVLTIGPAGEKLVPYACCTNDFYHQAGRGGTGALLGSKNIKALVVYGKKRVPLADPVAFQELSVEWLRRARSNERVAFRSRYGSLTTLDMTQRLGIVPVRNFQDGFWDGYETVNAERIREEYIIDDLTCLGCPMPCGKHVSYEWKGKKEELGGPEYETLAMMGSNLDIRSVEGISHLNFLCDELGVDTISTGAVLSCAIEAFERGYITVEQTDGLELRWGDVEIAETLVKKIAYRDGFGADLSLGVEKFAEKFGFDDSIALHVKGMELPGYDPRGTPGYALAYSIADRGGCHRRARPLTEEAKSESLRFAYEGKAKIVVDQENLRGYFHSLPVCDYVPTFFGMKPTDHAELLKYGTGMEFTPEDLLQVGARAINLARLFNNRCGVTAEDDTLPRRFFDESMPRGASAGMKISPEGFDAMKREYYELRGWFPNGVIKPETIEALDP